MSVSAYETLHKRLAKEPHRWLVTGVAGFIGSGLLETLLQWNQHVVGLDNFATGNQRNLDNVKTLVTPEQWSHFQFIQGDICNLPDCARACDGVDYILHHAARGSVPRSIEDPIKTNASNVDGFLNMLVASRNAKVKRFVYASSSTVYGDHPGLPKVEEHIGKPLSPYAVSKYVGELYADVFARTYGMETIGLRYFNVFGRRQNPEGEYAAVIPKWIAAMIAGKPVHIYGDGSTSRDFCYIDNAVQANLLAGFAGAQAVGQVYNIAVGDQTTLNELYRQLRDGLAKRHPRLKNAEPVYRDFRPGDVKHSLADIAKAKRLLGYTPTHNVQQGLDIAMQWYISHATER